MLCPAMRTTHLGDHVAAGEALPQPGAAWEMCGLWSQSSAPAEAADPACLHRAHPLGIKQGQNQSRFQIRKAQRTCVMHEAFSSLAKGAFIFIHSKLLV